jgi:hypothetical protein
MSKTLLAAMLLAIVGLSACKQNDADDSPVPSNYVKKGSIKFQNNSGDVYDIYLDDARYGNLYGGTSSTYPNIPIGDHRVKAVQTSNISGTPKLRQQIIIVYKDSVSTFAFPQ